MSINFGDLIPTEHKKLLIQEKIQQLAIEGFQLQINKAAAQSVENTENTINTLNANIAIISNAIMAYQEELNNLQ